MPEHGQQGDAAVCYSVKTNGYDTGVSAPFVSSSPDLTEDVQKPQCRPALGLCLLLIPLEFSLLASEVIDFH